jgi:hypothetical protein
MYMIIFHQQAAEVQIYWDQWSSVTVRLRNGGEARTALEGDLITRMLSSGSILYHDTLLRLINAAKRIPLTYLRDCQLG